MAALTSGELLTMAYERGISNPRVIMRKLLKSGAVAMVLKFGPDDARQEIVIERGMSRAGALEALASVNPS